MGKIHYIIFCQGVNAIATEKFMISAIQPYRKRVFRHGGVYALLTLMPILSQIMKIGKNVEENEMNVHLNDRRMDEVDTYRYLGVDISNDSGMSEEVNHRIGEARKACGALKDLWKKRHISREAKVGMYEGIIEPSLLYGSEAWTLKLNERKRIEAVEINCLRNICSLRRIGLVLWNNRFELPRLFSGDLQFTVDSKPCPVKAA